MARDYKPKAEATIRAEVRRLNRLSTDPALPIEDRLLATGALAALEWARGNDVPSPTVTIVSSRDSRTAALRQPGRAGADRGS